MAVDDPTDPPMTEFGRRAVQAMAAAKQLQESTTALVNTMREAERDQMTEERDL